MVKIVQQISDRLLNLVVPRVSAQACRRYLSTCVSCPGATGYLFRRMERWTCCGTNLVSSRSAARPKKLGISFPPYASHLTRGGGALRIGDTARSVRAQQLRLHGP